MTAAIPNIRRAAMAVLTSGAELTQREGQFLGGISFANRPLSEKQDRWLRVLLQRHGMADLMEAAHEPA